MDDKTGVAVRSTSVDLGRGEVPSESSSAAYKRGSPQTTFDGVGHGTPEVIDQSAAAPVRPVNPYLDNRKLTWREKFRFFKTKDFYIILALSQFLALAVTGANTLVSLLVQAGTNIPAFQSFFVYVLLNVIYSGWTIHKYGWSKYWAMLKKDWWKYIPLSFCDVQGNYFTVLAYNYTTILSAQLLNFWAIVIVVIVSFIFLKVRYHWAQILGIFVCLGGFGILLYSDHIHGINGGDIPAKTQLKGDLFALVGATAYGLSNAYEEWFVSGRPIYEVIGQLAFWGMIINGIQAAIFDRHSFQIAVWNADVIGYLVGYTLILTVFYSLVPILYRLSSAAFFNIGLLTSNFWGLIIGIGVFGYTVPYLYPIAFVVIMMGHFVYYLGKGVLGEAKKAWLGDAQEKGIAGVFTAKRKIEKAELSLANEAGDVDHHGREPQTAGHIGAGVV